MNEIYRLQRKIIYKRPFIFTLFLLFLIIYLIGTSAPDFVIGFFLGMLFIGTGSNIKEIRAYNRTWRNSLERICESIYEYEIFETYITVNIYRNNEKTCQKNAILPIWNR